MSALLEVDELSVHFRSEDGIIEAVDHVSFDVGEGEVVGLVGESGSGKSVSALAILRLIRPPGRVVSGTVRFEGLDLATLAESAMRHIRGAKIAMVSQSPRTALNPVIPVGRQIARLFELHAAMSPAQARRRALEMLDQVGIADVERRASQYAHQLSGGMCQRVMIAMALATSPRLLIADEPTTGLDVSIAARILELLRDLGSRTGAAILLITHDLGVVAETCDRVVVMHAGQVVESASVTTLFSQAAHPYARALTRSIPRVDRDVSMEPVPGSVPSLLDPEPGCRYAQRCPLVRSECTRVPPALKSIGPGHRLACYAYPGVAHGAA